MLNTINKKLITLKLLYARYVIVVMCNLGIQFPYV